MRPPWWWRVGKQCQVGSRSRRSRWRGGVRTDAVALVHSCGKTVTEVARELVVSAERLRGLVRQDAIGRGQGSPGELTTAERVSALRRERDESIRTAGVRSACRGRQPRRRRDRVTDPLFVGAQAHPQAQLPGAQLGDGLQSRGSGVRVAGARRAG
ncbi:transposase [Streptomyces sp. 7R007]